MAINHLLKGMILQVLKKQQEIAAMDFSKIKTTDQKKSGFSNLRKKVVAPGKKTGFIQGYIIYI